MILHDGYMVCFVNALVLAEWCETDYIWYIYADKMEFDLFMTPFHYGLYF